MTQEEQWINDWQTKKDPAAFSELFVRYQPVMHKFVNSYKKGGISEATLKLQANTQLKRAIDSYNPEMNTQPITHVYNHMQKIQRAAVESLTSGRIPENRKFELSTFNVAKGNLEDRLGREPSIEEMADEMKIDKVKVGRMMKELGGETNASAAQFDFYGNGTQFENVDKALLDYLYYELTGPEKVVFEYTFGYGGRPQLQNNEIAVKLNTNPMAITRMKKKMSDRIKSYR